MHSQMTVAEFRNLLEVHTPLWAVVGGWGLLFLLGVLWILYGKERP